ncbi:MAG: hypothetical protein WBX10_14000 [Candidatus Sulfotelmatobacter sp.]
MMRLKSQIDALFRPLIGQKAWGASVGYGSFVTIEFGRKRLYHGHYHGEWHVWLYLCEWKLFSGARQLADFESKKRMMQLAIGNLNGTALTEIDFDPQNMATTFSFDGDIHLRCEPFDDAPPDEECWMLFMPNGQVASLFESGIKVSPADAVSATSLARR